MEKMHEPSPSLDEPPLPAAEVAECIVALEALYNSDREMRTVQSYSRFMAFSVKGVLRYAHAQDLLHEAIARTLSGKRKWKSQQIDFVTHLRGCMRSIANEYAEEALRYSNETPVERRYKEDYSRTLIFDETRSRLQGHEIALAVFNNLLEGYSPAEIREMLNINLGVYNAARKRVSRCMQEMFALCNPGLKATAKEAARLFYGEPHA